MSVYFQDDDEQPNNVNVQQEVYSDSDSGSSERRELGQRKYSERNTTERANHGGKRRRNRGDPKSTYSNTSDDEYEKEWIIPNIPGTSMGGLDDAGNIDTDSTNGSIQGGTRKKLRTQEEDIRAEQSGRKNDRIDTEKESFTKMLINSFQKIVPRRRILHDIYSRNAKRRGNGLLDSCMGVTYNGAIFIICSHGDHYHVIHDCSYSSSTCRCTKIQAIKDNGFIRYGRRIICSNQFTIRHWRNLAEYCEKGERTLDLLFIAGRAWIQYSEDRHNSIRRCSDFGQKPMVDSGDETNSVHNFIKCGSEGNQNEGDDPNDIQGSEKAGSETGCKGDSLQKFIQKYPTSPLAHIFQTRHWTRGKYRYMPKNCSLIQSAMFNIGLDFVDMSIEDFGKYFAKCEPQNLIFNSPMGDINEYYYDIEKSVYVMEELLNHQFNDNANLVKLFLTDVYNICNKINPKKNTLFILSPPNAGKIFFFDAVIHFFINFGQLGNFNKYNSFPMQECCNKRIILWNEPCMEESSTETLKTLLGGDATNAKVKYSNDTIIQRTPVIVLSNNDIFPKDLAFRSRIIKYNWKTCSDLKILKKKPWPLAFHTLLEKYDLLHKNKDNEETQYTEEYDE